MNHMDKRTGLWEGLRNLRKSSSDKKIAGVCGGLGEHTPMPAWLWRAFFLALLFVWGGGLVLYIILWICMPPPDEADEGKIQL
jgi:phage shock protein PspC (stress-responsive transcriptional regulator)